MKQKQKIILNKTEYYLGKGITIIGLILWLSLGVIIFINLSNELMFKVWSVTVGIMFLFIMGLELIERSRRFEDET